jgi:protein-disulfide isomerase
MRSEASRAHVLHWLACKWRQKRQNLGTDISAISGSSRLLRGAWGSRWDFNPESASYEFRFSILRAMLSTTERRLDPMITTRRHLTKFATVLTVTALMAVGACNQTPGGGAGKAASEYEAPSDIAMGSADAKVVMIEYASITCPHCASFHNNVLPAIKEKYITPGKVRYVFREFPTPPIPLAMAGHLIARCAGGEKRYQIIDTLMRQQMEMVTQAQGPTGSEQFFLNVASSAGMSSDQFQACLKNEELLKTLAQVREDGIKLGVQGTPTVFVNGKAVEGVGGQEMSVADVSKALDAALATAK